MAKWTCDRCEKELEENASSFEDSNGNYIYQNCMERLEAVAEMQWESEQERLRDEMIERQIDDKIEKKHGLS